MTHSVGRFQLRYEGETSAYLTGGIYEKGKQILKYQPGKVQEFPQNNNWKFASFITPHNKIVKTSHRIFVPDGVKNRLKKTRIAEVIEEDSEGKHY